MVSLTEHVCHSVQLFILITFSGTISFEHPHRGTIEEAEEECVRDCLSRNNQPTRRSIAKRVYVAICTNILP